MSDVPEKVKRVAEAICVAHTIEPHTSWHDVARAAIKAMRMPTHEMCVAYWSVTNDDAIKARTNLAILKYDAMVDAALKNGMGTVESHNKTTGQWETAIPLPFYYGLLPWLWKRLTRWRDSYGRPAQLYVPWK